jgi:hypothetical protein
MFGNPCKIYGRLTPACLFDIEMVQMSMKLKNQEQFDTQIGLHDLIRRHSHCQAVKLVNVTDPSIRNLLFDIADGDSNWESKTIVVQVMSKDKPRITEWLSQFVAEFTTAFPDDPHPVIANASKGQGVEQTTTTAQSGVNISPFDDETYTTKPETPQLNQPAPASHIGNKWKKLPFIIATQSSRSYAAATCPMEQSSQLSSPTNSAATGKTSRETHLEEAIKELQEDVKSLLEAANSTPTDDNSIYNTRSSHKHVLSRSRP